MQQISFVNIAYLYGKNIQLLDNMTIIPGYLTTCIINYRWCIPLSKVYVGIIAISDSSSYIFEPVWLYRKTSLYKTIVNMHILFTSIAKFNLTSFVQYFIHLISIIHKPSPIMGTSLLEALHYLVAPTV